MTLLIDQITNLLSEASQAKIGIVVRFDFTGSKTQSLYQVSRIIYRVKKELHFDNIHIRVSPDNPDNEMWIFKAENKKEKPLDIKSIEIGEIE